MRRSNATRRVDTSGWWPEKQVVDYLGVAHITVKGYIRRGRLHPEREMRQLDNGIKRKILVYDPKEVRKIPPRSKRPKDPGELAARSFELFEQGLARHQIVKQLRLSPERVTELHEQWLDCGASELVITEEAKGEIARYVGPFDGVSDLVDRLRDLHGKELEATVPEGVSDADVEDAINCFLDQVDAPADAGPADAGPADAGPADAGPADVGPADVEAAVPRDGDGDGDVRTVPSPEEGSPP